MAVTHPLSSGRSESVSPDAMWATDQLSAHMFPSTGALAISSGTNMDAGIYPITSCCNTLSVKYAVALNRLLVVALIEEEEETQRVKRWTVWS